MILLGIDGGFATTGWCLAETSAKTKLSVVALGTIETKKSARKVPASVDNIRRAREIAAKLENLVLFANNEGQVKVAVDCICAEAMSHVPAAQAAAKLSLAWGVIAAIAHATSLPIVQVSPQDLKLAVTGSRKASKALMEQRLLEDYPECEKLLEDVPRSKREHPLDALGAIVACLDTDIVRAGMRR